MGHIRIESVEDEDKCTCLGEHGEVCEVDHGGKCWGHIRTCPICDRKVCYASGAADEKDREFPGICDECAYEDDLENDS